MSKHTSFVSPLLQEAAEAQHSHLRVGTSARRGSGRELAKRRSLWTAETLLQARQLDGGPRLPSLCQRRAPESGQFAAGSFLSSSSCVLLADSPPSPASCPWSDKAKASSPLPCPTPHLCRPLKLTTSTRRLSSAARFFCARRVGGEIADLRPPPPTPPPSAAAAASRAASGSA